MATKKKVAAPKKVVAKKKVIKIKKVKVYNHSFAKKKRIL